MSDVDSATELRSLLERERDAIQEIVVRNHGRRVRVFGSVARGEDGPNSDVDLLIDFEPGSSLFDLLHITEELEAALGCSVDVVSTGGLKDRDDHILREAIDL